eukprot:scaffold23790_cov79-Isochrysis_galbana.AAC.2
MLPPPSGRELALRHIAALHAEVHRLRRGAAQTTGGPAAATLDGCCPAARTDSAGAEVSLVVAEFELLGRRADRLAEHAVRWQAELDLAAHEHHQASVERELGMPSHRAIGHSRLPDRTPNPTAAWTRPPPAPNKAQPSGSAPVDLSAGRATEPRGTEATSSAPQNEQFAPPLPGMQTVDATPIAPPPAVPPIVPAPLCAAGRTPGGASDLIAFPPSLSPPAAAIRGLATTGAPPAPEIDGGLPEVAAVALEAAAAAVPTCGGAAVSPWGQWPVIPEGWEGPKIPEGEGSPIPEGECDQARRGSRGAIDDATSASAAEAGAQKVEAGAQKAEAGAQKAEAGAQAAEAGAQRVRAEAAEMLIEVLRAQLAEAEVRRVEAEARAKMEAEASAKMEAETRAKMEAEARAKMEAETRAKMEAVMQTANATAEAEARAVARAAAAAAAVAATMAAAVAEAEARAEAAVAKGRRGAAAWADEAGAEEARVDEARVVGARVDEARIDEARTPVSQMTRVSPPAVTVAAGRRFRAAMDAPTPR